MKSSALGMLGTEQIFPKHFGINLSLKNQLAAGGMLGGRSLGEGRRGGGSLFSTLGGTA